MQEEGKLSAYLGFARRAGKLTLGVQAAMTLKGRVFLLVADSGVGKNNRKEIEKLQKKLSCPLIYVTGLEEIVSKPCCKLAAVRDGSLAQAIIDLKTD